MDKILAAAQAIATARRNRNALAALADEIEQPAHIRQRFTVGY